MDIYIIQVCSWSGSDIVWAGFDREKCINFANSYEKKLSKGDESLYISIYKEDEFINSIDLKLERRKND